MPESFEEVPTNCAASPLASKWFAAYTASRHEKRVCEQLALRQVDSFLPLYKTSSQWKKRTPVTLNLPLFPNYVFIRISSKERKAVLQTPGVHSIVGSGTSGWELPEKEIEALRNGLCERKIEPHPYLVVGERARVASGVLAGLEGVIVRKKNSLQIVLSLDQIVRSVAIEVDASELEPISILPTRSRNQAGTVASSHQKKPTQPDRSGSSAEVLA